MSLSKLAQKKKKNSGSDMLSLSTLSESGEEYILSFHTLKNTFPSFQPQAQPQRTRLPAGK